MASIAHLDRIREYGDSKKISWLKKKKLLEILFSSIIMSSYPDEIILQTPGVISGKVFESVWGQMPLIEIVITHLPEIAPLVVVLSC